MNNPQGRDRWATRSAFILAAVGSAVGLGNIWRYPHVAYSGGGGAFLIPYFIALFTAGIPLLMLEFGLGHRMQGAAPMALGRVRRGFEFTGWWAAFGGLFITLYYCALMGWVCYYIWELLVVVFTGAVALPWETAGSAKAYLFNEVVTGTPGYEMGESDFSRFNWWAILFSGLVWAFVYYAIRRGVHSVGKVVWVTVTVPYLLLLILFFTAIGLPGASSGLNYYLAPDWSKYLTEDGAFSIAKTAEIASKAYGQVFFSLSIGFGIMMAYASFLPKRSDIANNAIITSFTNSGTEFFGGIITFCVLGFLAGNAGRFTGDVVGTSSIGIAFFSYPTAISQITDSTTTNALIGLAFFGGLLFLGVDSAFSLVEAAVAGICDKFGLKRKVVTVAFCIGGWFLGLVYCTPAGLILLDSADHYLSDYGLLLLGTMQCIVVGWIYGPKRLRRHIDAVSEWKLLPVWDICIKYITPIFLLFILFSNLQRELPALWDPSVKPYEGYSLPTQIFGISMVVLAAAVAIFLSRKQPARLDYYDRPSAEDTEPGSDDDGEGDDPGGDPTHRPAVSAPTSGLILWLGLMLGGLGLAVFGWAESPRTFGAAMIILGAVTLVAQCIRLPGRRAAESAGRVRRGQLGTGAGWMLAAVGLALSVLGWTGNAQWLGAVLAGLGLVIAGGGLLMRRLRRPASRRISPALMRAGLLVLVGAGLLALVGCKPVKVEKFQLTAEEKALFAGPEGGPAPKDDPRGALERATATLVQSLTMEHPAEGEARERSLWLAAALAAESARVIAAACPADVTAPHKRDIAEWADSSPALRLLLDGMVQLAGRLADVSAAGLAKPPAECAEWLAEANRGTFSSALDATIRGTSPASAAIKGAYDSPEEASVAAVRAVQAMALNHWVRRVVDATKPVRKLLPEVNTIDAGIEIHLFPLNPADFSMVRPYRQLTGPEQEALRDVIRRVAVRYPDSKTAAAWLFRAEARSPLSRIGEDPSGFAVRTLIDNMVEDLLAAWGDYKPMEQFRIQIVRLYAEQTHLTSPNHHALVMLLIGSVVLFGGLAWSLSRAIRGRAD